MVWWMKTSAPGNRSPRPQQKSRSRKIRQKKLRKRKQMQNLSWKKNGAWMPGTGRRMHPGITAPPSRARTITKLIRRRASRRMRLRNRMQSRCPPRKADFLLRTKRAALSVAWGWALRRWPRKEWTPPPGLPIKKYIRWKRTIPAWKLLISRKKPPNACTTLSKAEKSRKTNLPERRKEVGRIRNPAV